MNPTGPQVEDGHVRVANELYDAILRAGFSKRELLVVWAVIRRTYGFSKLTDDITLGQFSSMTGLDKANVSRTVDDLIKKRVLLKRQGRYGQVLGINKHYYQWGGLPKRQIVAKTTTGVAKTTTDRCQNGNEGVAKLATSTDISNKQSQQTPPNPQRGNWREIQDEYPKRLEPIDPVSTSVAYGEALRNFTHKEILAAVRRYAAFCDREGRIGTTYVMTPRKFLNTTAFIESPWAGDEGAGSLDDETRRRLAAHA